MIRLDMSDREYHGTQAISFHFLRDLETWGPAGAIGRMRGLIGKPETDAFRVGRLTHLAVLEGDTAVAARVACVPPTYTTAPPDMKPWNPRAKYCREWQASHPDKPTPAEYPDGPPAEEKPWNWNAGPCRAWLVAQEAEGRLVADAKEVAMVVSMRTAAMQTPDAAGLLRSGIPEAAFFQDEGGVPIKAKLDWIVSAAASADAWSAIVDLKTCDNISGFMDDIFRHHYHRQMAWYRWIVQQETGRRLPAALLAVEKGSVHRVRVYDLSDAILDAAHDTNMRSLELALDLWRRDDWPRDLGMARQPVVPPAWFSRHVAEATAAEDPY